MDFNPHCQLCLRRNNHLCHVVLLEEAELGHLELAADEHLHLLRHVPRGASRDVLGNVVHTPLPVYLEIVGQSHEMHEFSGIEKSVLLRMNGPHHGFLHDSREGLTNKPSKYEF